MFFNQGGINGTSFDDPRVFPEIHARALAMAKATGKRLNQWAEGVLGKVAHFNRRIKVFITVVTCCGFTQASIPVAEGNNASRNSKRSNYEQ